MGGGAGGSVGHWLFKLYIMQLDFARFRIVLRRGNRWLPPSPLPSAAMLTPHCLVPGKHRTLVSGNELFDHVKAGTQSGWVAALHKIGQRDALCPGLSRPVSRSRHD